MTDPDRKPSEVLHDAIIMEAEGKEFFERASGMMTRKRSRDMFMSLAGQEDRHIAVLTHQMKLLDKGLDWDSLEDARKSFPSSVSVFSEGGVGHIELRSDAGELEVIDLGIEVEKKSIEYYRARGREVDDPNAKQVFNWLVGEESGHLTILQAERDIRSGTGFYYDNAEFSLETR